MRYKVDAMVISIRWCTDSAGPLLQILMVQADRGCDDGIGRGQHPAHDGNEMHAVKHQSIANGQSFMLTDIGDAGRRGQVMPLTAVVEHRESVVIALDKDTYDRCDPARY